MSYGFLCKHLILLARLARLERATYGLEVRCSIQLSYRRIFFLRNPDNMICFFCPYQICYNNLKKSLALFDN